jgi:hypothetical protein
MSSNSYSDGNLSSLQWVTCKYCKKKFPDQLCLSWHQSNQMQCSPFDINAKAFIPETRIINKWIRTKSDVDLIREVNQILIELEDGDLYI